MKEEAFITKFQMTGGCEVDVNRLKKKWNSLYFLSQWGDEYRIIKQLRKDSTRTAMKLTISADQVREIIDAIGLVELKSIVFEKGSTWKRPSDIF